MKRLGGLLLIVMLLSGCIQKPHVSTLKLDGTLQPFYAQTLDWQNCSHTECASFEVPLDYNELSGQTIEIQLNRIKATDKGARLGSILINPGGPGGSAIDYVDSYKDLFTERLMKRFDLIGMDPRGVGYSAPIRCTSDAEIDKSYASEPTPDTPAEVADFEKPFDMQKCADDSGPIFAHISTVEVAKDMDILRALLGEPKLNYLGKSYGTQMGAVYASMFPDKVGQFVLDGAVDMKKSELELTLGQAVGFENEFRRFARYCAEEYVDCALGSTADQVLKKLLAFMKKLDTKPLKTNDPDRPLTEGLAWMAVTGSMYSPQWTWDWTIESLDSAYKGDGQGLLEMADWNAGRESDGTYLDNSFDAFSAINCLDYPYEPFDRQTFIAEAKAVAPLLGGLFGWMEGGCKNWPVSGIPMPHDVSAAAAAATTMVVVGTVNDPATPVEWARALTKQLVNATYLEFNGDGHTAYFNGSRCIDYRVDMYFINGTLPPKGLVCQPDTYLVR